MLLYILFICFCIVVGIQIIYYGFLFSNFAFSSSQKTTQQNLPISVIVCAKNEAENIKQFLPSILNQNYTDFEVVLINDASTDDTLDLFEEFEAKHNNIKIVNVKNIEAFWGNKKYALTLGIKAATHEHLLFTDADCKPVSSNWITEMTAHFSEKKSIILGYGAYSKNTTNFLNKLIRFETVLTVLQYFSFAKIGMPYMGVGRNLAYTKTEFFNANGFMNHMKVHSGDDDLFVNQAATSKNTSICFSEDSFTESIPKTTVNSWIKQKRRHITTANLYKLKHKITLGLFYISQVLFWLLSIVLVSLLYKWEIVVSLIGIRFFIHYLIYGFTTKKLKETDILWLLPVLEISLLLTQLGIFIANSISKPQRWN